MDEDGPGQGHPCHLDTFLVYLFLYFFFSEKSFEISSELSAKQTNHMKCQNLFSLKNKKKNKKLE